jgi:hypothetical protein
MIIGGAAALAVIIVHIYVAKVTTASTPLATNALQSPRPVSAPPTWKEVREDPSFAGLSPEKQLVVFDRWRLQAYKYGHTLPDWKDNEAEFNAKTAATASALSEAAGGLTPAEARVKIATDALELKEREGGAPLTEEQTRELLRAKGDDISNAYYEWKEKDGKSVTGPLPKSASVMPESYSTPWAVATQPPAPALPTFRVVNVPEGDSLNLRQGPGSNYPVVATIPAGFRGITLSTQRYTNGTTIWRQISAGGYNGYVNETYLEADTQR